MLSRTQGLLAAIAVVLASVVPILDYYTDIRQKIEEIFPIDDDTGWTSIRVTMSNPDFRAGESGNVSLPDGYEIGEIRYRSIGSKANHHQFKFNLIGPEGVVKNDITYISSSLEGSWERKAQTFQMPDHTLRFAFSNWDESTSDFHYVWE